MLEFKAAIMGIVEGLTEFLPVSSTGHLILVQEWIGFDKALGEDLAKTFDIFIQVGAILAVIVAYPSRFSSLVDVRQQTGFRGIRGIGLLICTSLPAMAVGFAARGWIKQHLYQSTPVAVGLIVGSLWILWTEWRRPVARTEGLDGVQWKQAIGIGLFQCLALWPGVSRSAATILGGMLLGVDRKTATEYSFFAAIPVLGAAAAYEMLKSFHHIHANHAILFGIGLAVSFVSALAAVKWLLHYVGGHSLSGFAWYRLALAAIVLLFAVI
jgi:undecaprenyl-diphosphatase